MSFTDILTILLSTFLIFNGFNRGFISSLLGPISLIISSVIAFIYLKITNNFGMFLYIGLFGPFILGWILRSSVHSWFALSGAQGSPNLISRIAGAFITWLWGMSMLVITVLLLSQIPENPKPLRLIYKDIHYSKLYQIIKPLEALYMDNVDAKVDLKTLSEDKRIQSVINDPDIIKDIKQNNFSSLMSNPKIAALVQDPKLMKQLFKAYQQMMQEKMNAQESK